MISVGSGTLKIAKSASAPNDNSAFFFRGLGDLTVRNQSMTDFASWMQTVLDKPVVDQTELPGKYDFQLKWTPDESQFATFRESGPLSRRRAMTRRRPRTFTPRCRSNSG